MESKQDIRKRICTIRESYSLEQVQQKSRKIVEQILRLPEYIEAEQILLYADFRHEVMTKDIFMDAISKKKKVYFPKCNPQTSQMSFYQIVSVRQLTDGAFGIKEPNVGEEYLYCYQETDNTLMIVPGVAFDMKGSRVGYGKGYYDRFLSKKRRISLVGVCFADQILEEIPKESFDITMDKIVTEDIIYSFLRI